MKKKYLMISMLAALAITGCATINEKYVANPADTQDFLANKPSELQPFFKTLYEEGERNSVLNLNRLALAAIENGNYDIAAQALDNSMVKIDAIYSDNPSAEAARSKFNAEKVKDFKGEAYERAMTYYYRGLLYLKTGEFDNARASFLGASLQDKFSEDQTYNQDFAVMDYLAGWSSMCIGDHSAAKDHLQRAATIDPKLTPLTLTPPQKLVIMETGHAPLKVRYGKYKQILQFVDSELNKDTYPHLFIDNSESGQPILAGDTHFQATTRGGRLVDSINAGKANFKQNAETIAKIGAGVAVAGAAMAAAGNQYGGYAAGAGALISLVSAGVAAATTPEADIRTWEGLPKQIHLASIDPSITDPAKLQLKVNDITTPFSLSSVNSNCSFFWSRNPSSLQLRPVTQIIAQDTDDDRGPKNQSYRDQLKTQF